MSQKTDNFINTVGLIARNEYLTRDKWVLPSICISQAALESGWNLEARTLFGIKGAGTSFKTTEYINGEYVDLVDSFRTYPNVAGSVVGYYDFLTQTPRYSGVVCNPDYKDAVYKLIHTTDGAPYATDPTYISKIVRIIEQYDLTKWDTIEVEKHETNIDDLVNAVIRGEMGNGQERKDKLGDLYDEVQSRVNEILNGSTNAAIPKVDIDDLARRVIRGEMGNGQERRDKLGDLYDEVQSRVNEMLS